MRQRYRETAEPDSHDLLFGPADDDHDGTDGTDYGDGLDGSRPSTVTGVSRREAREAQARHGRRRRNGRLVWIMVILMVAVVAVATWLVVIPVYHYFSPSDYDGSGAGTVVVEVKPNDGAAEIGATLAAKNVVASSRAFTNAADDNSDSQDIQPGSYRLHSHMSGAAAVTLLLNPSSRVNSDVTVTEGANILDVERRLAAKPCNGSSTKVCGPGLSRSSVQTALRNVKSLGLPTDYKVSGGNPSSVEGFLFPATYYFPNRTDASDALQQMITKFTDQARSTNFTARAGALGITPYQQLVVASIAQAEAKFPEDYAKVTRVILNRLKIRRQLQVDATSVYGLELQGRKAGSVDNAVVTGPYNTYRNKGLPPTPIANPGADAMNGAAHPATGNWIFYVNGDAAGHLYFTNSEAAFTKAVAKCKANHWGCG